MPVTVEFNYSKCISSAKTLEETFNYLANWHCAIPNNFPGLESFDKVDAAVYRWQFQKLQYASQAIQLQFVTRFEVHKPDRVEMRSVQGNRVNGKWRVVGRGQRSEVQFEIHLTIELALPFLFKAMAAPIAQKELTKLFDHYLTNVEKTLSQ